MDTSLEPCAKELVMPVNTCRYLNTPAARGVVGGGEWGVVVGQVGACACVCVCVLFVFLGGQVDADVSRSVGTCSRRPAPPAPAPRATAARCCVPTGPALQTGPSGIVHAFRLPPSNCRAVPNSPKLTLGLPVKALRVVVDRANPLVRVDHLHSRRSVRSVSGRGRGCRPSQQGAPDACPAARRRSSTAS